MMFHRLGFGLFPVCVGDAEFREARDDLVVDGHPDEAASCMVQGVEDQHRRIFFPSRKALQ